MSDDNELIMISGARVSFPHLFKAPVIKGEEGKMGARLMLDPRKHKKTIALLNERVEELRKDKLKNAKLPPEKICVRDGDDMTRPEYEGCIVVSTNTNTKPLVISGDGRTPITDEENSPIYSGCFANVKIRLWAQNNDYGKRINAELIAIQFLRDGEPLDSRYVSVDTAMQGFGPVEVDEDDDFLEDA